MKFYLPLFICLMMFCVVAGCGPSKMMPCTVGLTLKPGESCRYTASDNDYSFDFVFSAMDGGASFPKVYLKSPGGTYGPTGGPTALHGGTSTMRRFDDQAMSINSSTAAICLGSNIIEFMDRQDLKRKCFTARSNPDGSWTIKELPLPN